ncbi:MAG: Tat proofreading chaperone DmsD [Eggerthella lenta]
MSEEATVPLSEDVREAIAFVGETLGPFYLQDPVKGDAGPAFAAMAAIDVAQAAVEWPFVDEAEARCDLDLMRSGLAEGIDADGLVWEYRRLFIGPAPKPAPPWGSVYTDRECVVFGATTLELRAWMRSHGIARQTDDKTPEDHMGLMLVLMAWIARNQPQDPGEFLRLHLLTWSSHFLDQLIEAAGQPFYEGLARLTKASLEGIQAELGWTSSTRGSTARIACMISGFDTALGEITLVLFTTLAPSGVVAFICMGLPVLGRGASVVLRQRLNVFLGLPSWLPWWVSSPRPPTWAAPLTRCTCSWVGRSPLSTEVFCAVVFLALAGLYWLYNFVEHPKPQLQRAWLVLAMLAGAVFVAAVGCAYAADTIVSWHTVYVPLNLMLNALVGGPILAIAGLRAAGYEPVEGRMGRVLTMVAAAALAVNVVTFGVQGADLASIENSYLTAAELVPSYGLMVCAFGVLGMAGIGLDAVELWPRRVRLSVGRAAGAAVLVLAGIFVMRFAFYMMHMTVGLGV